MEEGFKGHFASVSDKPFFKGETTVYTYVKMNEKDTADKILIRINVDRLSKDKLKVVQERAERLKEEMKYFSWALQIEKIEVGDVGEGKELWVVCEECQPVNLKIFINHVEIRKEEKDFFLGKLLDVVRYAELRKERMQLDDFDVLVKSGANSFCPTIRVLPTAILLPLIKSTIQDLRQDVCKQIEFFVDAEKYGKCVLDALRTKKPILDVIKMKGVDEIYQNVQFPTFDFNKIEPIEMVGTGAYGKIIKVRYEGEIYALKESDLSKKEEIEKEAMVLKWCDHPNIIKSHGIASATRSISTKIEKKRERPGTYLYLLLDYYEAGNINDFVEEQRKIKKHMTSEELDLFFKQMIAPMEYLQNTKKFIHGDLKHHNFLISKKDGNTKIVLTDFGNCRSFANESQVLRGTSRDYNSAKRTPLTVNHDLYPLGVCLYRLMTHKIPYGENETEIQEAVQKKKGLFMPKRIKNDKLMDQKREVVTKMLALKENERETFNQLFKEDYVVNLLK
ncbi:hypothetical protein EIN_175680 [Entamoeba invadens IP1]|uniref:hypothetical protein n=1 Tax=Entamoeba invadens IP1 TaxID=370355 RepID=UPI0002C3F84E|nr:hypothetical protein EIN_175680 [Entamoeba invadens IP1]ELP93781.1 hypothetical protein EIN_175680 [Entamoeba invadens IP1]|eukprot:XP_004260552.1 hypothetical protein EIN_175680 [Entamoeba invadens IP1]